MTTQDNDYGTPRDYANPDFTDYDAVHNWRNYIGDELRAIWATFSDEQKRVIARQANITAEAEDWD